tara:strand:- start:297 stop:665 length:369 start_codon:yes stop_codon:yes gene_type:complete
MSDENILYKIIDKNTNNTNIDLDYLLDDIDAQLKTIDKYDIINCDYQFNYDEYETYTVCDLIHILSYYNIPRRKMKKVDMIEAICSFEMTEENEEVVMRRQKLWEFILELKNDNYLSKFITF